MLRRRHRKDSSYFEIFIALVLVRFVLLAMLLIFLAPKEEQNKKNDFEEKNAIRVEVTWEDNRKVDVDLWGKAPGDRPVGWSNKGGKYLDLVRDDLGNYPGSHYEIIYGRKLQDGEYVFNLHLYSNYEPNYPIVPVQIKVYQIDVNSKGPPNTIYTKTVELFKNGDEITILRFTVRGGFIDLHSFNFVYYKLYGRQDP